MFMIDAILHAKERAMAECLVQVHLQRIVGELDLEDVWEQLCLTVHRLLFDLLQREHFTQGGDDNVAQLGAR